MACSNCFNGCTEIVSDQCVKYTGIDIPSLEISNGDTLSAVQSKITEFILSLSNGTGINPIIEQEDLCELISSFLPVCDTINLNDVLSALFKSICFLNSGVESCQNDISTINASYSIGCLEGVQSTSNTHDILQAAINKLCQTDAALTALALDVATNYVKISDLNTLIQAYLDSIAPTSLQKNKMVPYVAYEYYGPLTNFDITGAGSGEWVDVYLCNGNNGTPDRRGRTAVGTTDGSMQGGAMSATVNPSVSGNPSYSLAGVAGQNNVSLTVNQIPSHTHTATATSTASPHSHFTTRNAETGFTINSINPVVRKRSYGNNDSYNLSSGSGTADVGPTSPSTVSVSTSVVVNATGGSLPHTNVQPTIGAYFIMYIP
jgi:microcystin-dependent protein